MVCLRNVAVFGDGNRLFLAMRVVKMSSIGVIYGVSTVILLTAIGVLFFDEKLHAMEVVAIILGLSSIILLVRFN